MPGNEGPIGPKGQSGEKGEALLFSCLCKRLWNEWKTCLFIKTTGQMGQTGQKGSAGDTGAPGVSGKYT